MSNEDVVKAFLEGMATPISELAPHLRKFMTDDCVWENTGFPPAVGIDDIINKHATTERIFGEYSLLVDLQHIATSADGVVFTERTDTGCAPDGIEDLSIPTVGVFHVRDGKISRWTDYFDPRSLLERLAVLPDIEEFYTGRPSATG